MQESVEPRMRVVGAGGPETPDGVPGPLRLLALLEELCGPREFWPGATYRELAWRLGTTDKTASQWMDVVEEAGVGKWRRAGGRKPSTCYLLVAGRAAHDAVVAVLERRPVWRSGAQRDSTGQTDSSGHASGHGAPPAHADSDGPSGHAETLPVMLPVIRPVERPYTTSSSSSSSSSALPVDAELPVEDQDETGSPPPPYALFPGPDCGLTLPGRLARMLIDPKEWLVTALNVAPAELREAALLRAFEHRAKSPTYVLACLETLQLFAAAARSAVSVVGEEPASEPEGLGERSSIDDPSVQFADLRKSEESAPPAGQGPSTGSGRADSEPSVAVEPAGLSVDAPPEFDGLRYVVPRQVSEGELEASWLARFGGAL